MKENKNEKIKNKIYSIPIPYLNTCFYEFDFRQNLRVTYGYIPGSYAIKNYLLL